MRIMFVSYMYWPPHFGGALLRMITTFQSLAERGHQITALTAGVAGLPSFENRDGLCVHRSPFVHASKVGRLLRRLTFFTWVLWRLAREDYAIVYLGSLPGVSQTTCAMAGWILAKTVKMRKARSVYSYTLADTEEDAIRSEGFSGFWWRRYLNAVTHVVGISPAIVEGLQKLLPQHDVVYLTNGVRDDIFVPVDDLTRQQIRSAAGIAPDLTIFTFLGSVGRRKGFDTLAQAFAELAPEHPEWRLWVIGPRSRRESQNIVDQEVEEVCQPLQAVPEQVRYWGRINDRPRLAQILAASDVFVFPSRREGMGVAPLEAMSAGVPVIIARLPGITDLANIEGKTGLYVEPGNVEQLKDAMRRLGEDAELRRRMGRAARQRIVEAFSWDQYVSRWEQLYARGEIEQP